MAVSRVCVFCASSRQVDDVYFEAARVTGEAIARAGLSLVYGGGGSGLMGQTADAALAAGGTVIGIIPEFMKKLEWAHDGLSELHTVETMHDRVGMMIEKSDAFVALPGGSGTLDELFQVLTWKRLGLHTSPIVLVNTGGYYGPLIEQMRRCIDERFMHEKHADLWSVVDDAGEVVRAIREAPVWDSGSVTIANI